MLFVAIVLLVAATPLLGQESVCALFSHLEGADGQRVMVSGDLIISKDLAVLGAADCDNRYIFREQEWPTALSLRPSPAVTPAQLQQFQNAGVEADRLRQAGKTVSASASFSGRVRLAESGDFPAELTFDSFENLKIEALPDASTLTVIPICDLFQNLPARKGERIAVRGEYVSTMEGTWIVGACKGKFVTDGYRWPVALTYASPAYYSQAMARLYEANWSSTSLKAESLARAAEKGCTDRVRRVPCQSWHRQQERGRIDGPTGRDSLRQRIHREASGRCWSSA